MKNYIAPGRKGSTPNALSLEADISLFKRQVTGWLFKHVRALRARKYAHRENAGFAILMLVTSYFEAIENYRKGASGSSRDHFIAGLRSVLPTLAATADNVLADLYDQLRCGLYHQAAPKCKIAIAHAGEPIAIQLASTGSLAGATIDPWLLARAVENHFNCYVAQLRDPSQLALRQAFQKFRGIRRASVGQFTTPVTGARSTYP